MIRLIDFGMSQSKYLRNSAIESGFDNWKADFFMALAAFWGISSASIRANFERFAIQEFGSDAVVILRNAEVDIQRMITNEGSIEDFL